MNYQAKHPAAFINALSEGPKADVIEWLQRTWDDYVDAQARIAELEGWRCLCGIHYKAEDKCQKCGSTRPIAIA